ncbi:MAG: MATE family efflux transporter [Clostridiales bacterium]|nr:MATE family efflux transporter [Clostridiales bacterium]
MQNDLSSGKPSSVLWRFCLPLFASMLFQQMYSIADSLIAGGLIGEDALAAVGNSYEITFIYLAFAFGANIGCSVIVSRLFGAGRHEQMKTAVYTSILLVIVMCVFLMSMGFIGNSVLLQLIRTPKDIFADSRNYLLIYTASLPFMFFYNLSTGIFSGIGDSRTPFLFLAISSTANVILDYVFVKFLHLGVPGIAWATLICQGISCILSMTVVFHTLQRIKCEHKPALFSAPLLKQILAIAIPSIFQQSFISVGNIILQRIINAFGTAVMAGYSASIKLNNLMVSSFTTLGNGISNYTSQNIGAQKPERIPEGHRVGIHLEWLLCLPFLLLYLVFGKYLLLPFMENPTGEAIRTGIMFLRIVSPFYFVAEIKLVSDGVLRGSNHLKEFMIATFTDLILRVVLSFALSKTNLGANGIWCSWPIGWTVGTILSYFFYKSTVKKLMSSPQKE